jgi:hypothetical protein
MARKAIMLPPPTPFAKPPVLVQYEIVEGPGYRCVAYCDEDGRWRSASNHQELRGEIRILG